MLIQEETTLPRHFIDHVTGRRFFTFIPGIVLILGLVLTSIEVTRWQEQENQRHLQEFQIRANELAAGLERRILYNSEILQGVAGLFASSTNVSRSEFHRYISYLNLSAMNPAVTAIGYTQLVSAQEKLSYISAVRAEGITDYNIFPEGERTLYAPIRFLEPYAGRNVPTLGFDLLSDPTRTQAALEARDQAKATMTARVVLLQDAGIRNESGIIIYIPIYRHNMQVTSVEQRRKALQGWVHVSIRSSDLISHYLQSEYPDLSKKIAIRLYSGLPSEPSVLMFDSSPANSPNIDYMTLVRTNHLLGTDWQLQLKPLPAYWESIDTGRASNIASISGLVLSLFAALLSYALIRSHNRVKESLLQAEKANQNIAEQEALLRAIYDTSGIAVLLISTTGRILYSNQRVAELFHQPYEALPGNHLYQLTAKTQQNELHKEIGKLLSGEKINFTLEQHYFLDDGTDFLGLSTGEPFVDKKGNIIGIVIVFDDITERRKNETAMRLASTVLDASPGGILVTDAKKRIISVNPAFTRITGYTLDDIRNKNPKILSSGQQDDAFYQKMWLSISENGYWEGELVNRRKDGQLLPEILSISRVLDEKGEVINYVGMFLDISERWEAEARIQHLAHHDYLTGLPNRILFLEHASQAIAMARRYERKMAILFIDLDHFKPINDKYGHSIGDAVLKLVAQRLLNVVRESDTVCRQGGDEFLVLLPEWSAQESLEMLALKLLSEILKPCSVNGYQLTVSASIGIATYPDNGDSVDAIIQSADTAMYRAKAEIGNHISFARYINETHPTR